MKKHIILIMTNLRENMYTRDSQLERKAENMNSCVKVVRLRCGVLKDTHPSDVTQFDI